MLKLYTCISVLTKLESKMNLKNDNYQLVFSNWATLNC